MNSTITNFGYPVNIIEEYTNWVVMLRPVQLTLGSLILACKEDVQSFSALSNSSQGELSRVVVDTEKTLKIYNNYSCHPKVSITSIIFLNCLDHIKLAGFVLPVNIAFVYLFSN